MNTISCNRCGYIFKDRKDEKFKINTYKIGCFDEMGYSSTDEYYDLCTECLKDFKVWIGTREK